MNRTRFALTVAAGLAVLGVTVGFAAQSSGPASAVQVTARVAPGAAVEQYAVDGVHSSVMFRIEHMGIAPFYAMFNEIDGTYTYDPENPEASSFDIAVATDSVDSRNQGRDRHLKSPDFFNAAEYPTITFKSTKVEPSADDTLRVTGDLTLHGVTKSVTVDMKLIGRKDTGRQGFKSGLESIFTIKRSDFGMDTYVTEGALGDEVKLFIGLEGARQ